MRTFSVTSDRILWFRIVGFVVALAMTSAATLVISGVQHYVLISNVSLLYLSPILVAAVYFGTGPALCAAIIAALEYDFFLLPPAFTLTIRQLPDVLAFTVFALVATLTGQLAARARARAEAAAQRATESAVLYELGQSLTSGYHVDDVLRRITEHVIRVFAVDGCAMFVPDEHNHLRPAAATGWDGAAPDRAGAAAVSWVFRQGASVGLEEEGRATRPSRDAFDRREYVPLRAADRVVGVMAVGQKRRGEPLSPDERRLLTVFAAQAASAVARAQSEEERRRLQILEETDKIKSSLLSAVSHDLRTPLATIKASATSLLLAETPWTTEQGRQFLEAISGEADRLNRLVSNLLDLSRIEAGVLRPVLDWYDLDEVVQAAVQQARGALEDRRLVIDVPPDLPLVRLDFVLVGELLYNLLENAARYSPASTEIGLSAGVDDHGLRMAVVDHGRGLPPHERQRVFDRFVRLQSHGDRDHGAGLGLAICRGIADAHGGTIDVEDTPGGGTTFIFRLPATCLAEAAYA